LTAINPYKKFSKINPQRENGNRQIASDVFLALTMAKLSGGEYQIILFIIDKTWGFNKLSDSITYSQIAKATKLTRPAIINNIKKLEKKRILVVNRKVVKGSLPVNEYLFNKHYDTWLDETGKVMFTSSDIELIQKEVKLVKQSLPIQAQTGKVSKQKLVKQSLPTKEIYTKEINNINNNICSENYKFSERDKELALYLEKLIKDNKPDYKFRGKHYIEKWANEVRLMRERDKRDYDRIKRVMEFALNDDFWKYNILSMEKLRKQFDRLEMQMNKKKKKSFIDMELERIRREKMIKGDANEK